MEQHCAFLTMNDIAMTAHYSLILHLQHALQLLHLALQCTNFAHQYTCTCTAS